MAEASGEYLKRPYLPLDMLLESKHRDAWAALVVALVVYMGSFGLVLSLGDYRLAFYLLLAVPLAGVLLCLRGLSERKQKQQAEQVLKASEERHRHLVEQLPLMIYVDYANETADNIYTSPQTLDICGYSQEEWAADSNLFQKILHPEDSHRVLAACDRFHAGLDREFVCEYRVVAKDGRVVWVLDRAVLKRDSNSEALYVQGYWQDISDAKRAEAALKESELRYRELFDNANDLIASVDLEERIIAVNDAFVKASGYSRDELLGRRLDSLHSNESLARAVEATQRKLAGEEESSQYMMELCCKDGALLHLEASTRVVYEDGQPIGTQGILRDVTERERLEEQLRQAQKMEAIGKLAGGVAHDFNNLLTAISGFAEFSLLLAEEEGHDEIGENIREIQGAATRAADLTRQLLTFSRQQLRQLEVLDLRDVVGQVKGMLSRMIGEHIELVTEFPDSVPLVKADRGQLEQVVFNLAVNSRDALGPSGGQLKITLSSDEESVILTVSDDGEGMSEETQERIFEPFFTTKEVGKGTGLGLSTVYGIVSQAEGRILVESELGEGTSFSVYLPVYTGDELGASDESISGSSSVVTAPVSSTIR